jgi:hypothetical protein
VTRQKGQDSLFSAGWLLQAAGGSVLLGGGGTSAMPLRGLIPQAWFAGSSSVEAGLQTGEKKIQAQAGLDS